MKYLFLLLMLAGCLTTRQRDNKNFNKYQWQVGKDGSLTAYAKKKNKHEPDKAVFSNGDTLYSNLKTHTMLKLLKSGDTVVIIK